MPTRNELIQELKSRWDGPDATVTRWLDQQMASQDVSPGDVWQVIPDIPGSRVSVVTGLVHYGVGNELFITTSTGERQPLGYFRLLKRVLEA